MSRNFTDLISGISIDFYITFKHNQSFKRKMDFSLNLLEQICAQYNVLLNNISFKMFETNINCQSVQMISIVDS